MRRNCSRIKRLVDRRKDEFIGRFFGRIPPEVAASFSDRQLAAIKMAFGARHFGSHKVDIRRAFGFGRRRWYLVFLIGSDRPIFMSTVGASARWNGAFEGRLFRSIGLERRLGGSLRQMRADARSRPTGAADRADRFLATRPAAMALTAGSCWAEGVALSPHGFDVDRVPRIHLDLLPQAFDEIVDAAVVAAGVLPNPRNRQYLLSIEDDVRVRC